MPRPSIPDTEGEAELRNSRTDAEFLSSTTIPVVSQVTRILLSCSGATRRRAYESSKSAVVTECMPATATKSTAR